MSKRVKKMLTKDLLRYKLQGSQIQPQYVASQGKNYELAAAIIQFWQSQIGHMRHQIQDALTPVLYQSRNLLIARGLNKLVEDHCQMSDGASQQELRAAAFAASAESIRAGCGEVRQHQKDIAEKMEVSAQQLYDNLYGDLPQFAVLATAWQASAHELIAEYNMAQAQGLCIYARRMRICIVETDTGFRRQLLKALRFRRLLAEIKQDDLGNLILDVSGPASVLEQHQRYGLGLALFLPAVACASEWSLELDLRAPRKECSQELHCSFDHTSPLRGDNKFLSYIPEELKKLLSHLEKKLPQWQFDDQAPLSVLDKGEVLVPDLRVRARDSEDQGNGNGNGKELHCIEFFHRWHSRPLQRRLRQISEGQAPKLLIAVDKQIFKQKEFADIENSEIFQQRGFAFRDFPTVTAMKQCIERNATTN